MRVAIVLPHSYATFDKRFVLSFLACVCNFYIHNKENELNIFVQDGYDIPFMREKGAEAAIKWKADAILWMDTDQSFPADLILKMIKHLEDPTIEAITGLYTWKQEPFIPHVYPKLDKGKFKIACAFPLDEVFDVAGAGFGCLMMRTSVFKRVKKPWFDWVLEDGDIKEGEDLRFCRKAKMKMICDPTILCGHFFAGEVNINTHLDYNRLEVKDGVIQGTDERFKEIADEHIKRVKRLA